MNPFVALPSERSQFYLQLLTDKNPAVRKKAADALGKISDAASVVKLKEQLEVEADAGVRKAIEKAIAKIGAG